MPKFGITVFPGSNCDHDCYHVVKSVLGKDCEFVWHEETGIDEFDCIIVPGGFSYGDYLRPGAIAALSPVMVALREYAARGGLVLAICNGFQVLVESGILPGALVKNTSLRFVCRWVHLRVENADTPFTNLMEAGQVVRMPVAHGDGRYFADASTLERLNRKGRVAFRYCDRDGRVTDEANPNGSLENIAGIISEGSNVLGMMPHPERCSEGALGGTDGLLVFNSILSWLGKGKACTERAKPPSPKSANRGRSIALQTK
jgi:phosphoribosylformylglycinamidine synthase